MPLDEPHPTVGPGALEVPKPQAAGVQHEQHHRRGYVYAFEAPPLDAEQGLADAEQREVGDVEEQRGLPEQESTSANSEATPLPLSLAPGVPIAES